MDAQNVHNHVEEKNIQSGWSHDWILPRQLTNHGNLNIHQVIPGPFERPRLVKASPFVISLPSTSQEREEMTRELRRGIPDPWEEYLVFNEVCSKRKGRNIEREHRMQCTNLKITKDIWQRFGMSLNQGIPDPWKSHEILEKECQEEDKDKKKKKQRIKSKRKMQNEEIETANEFPQNFYRTNPKKSYTDSSKSLLTSHRDFKSSPTQTECADIAFRHHFPLDPCKYTISSLSPIEQCPGSSSHRPRDNVYCITLKKNTGVKLSKVTARLKRLLKKFVGEEKLHNYQCDETLEFQGNFDRNLICYRCNFPYFRVSSIEQYPVFRDNDQDIKEIHLDRTRRSCEDDLSYIQSDKYISESVKATKERLQNEKSSSSISSITELKKEEIDCKDIIKTSSESIDSFKTYTIQRRKASRRYQNHIDNCFRQEMALVKAQERGKFIPDIENEVFPEETDVSPAFEGNVSLQIDAGSSKIRKNERKPCDNNDETTIGEILNDDNGKQIHLRTSNYFASHSELRFGSNKEKSLKNLFHSSPPLPLDRKMEYKVEKKCARPLEKRQTDKVLYYPKNENSTQLILESVSEGSNSRKSSRKTLINNWDVVKNTKQ